MENFIFALNSTMPVFLIILLGWVLKKIGMLNDNFNKIANNYVFKIALPCSLFNSISTMDFYTDFNFKFVAYCFVITLIFFSVTWALSSLLIKDKRLVGAFTQGCTRSSAAILGVAFAVNIYGSSGMVPMMIIASVPLFNIFAVLILLLSPHTDENGNLIPKTKQSAGQAVLKALKGIATNPIILGIVAGIPFAVLRISFPTMITKTISTVGGTASPIALLVVGASFSGGEALKKLKPAAVATFIKLIALPAVFLPIAAYLGFRNTEMVAILILLGSPTTVVSYVMTRTMKGDYVLASNIVVLSTLFSSVSLTLWIFALKSFGLM
jgi:malate permease and related proteins